MIAKVLPILLKCQIVTTYYKDTKRGKSLMKIELKKALPCERKFNIILRLSRFSLYNFVLIKF